MHKILFTLDILSAQQTSLLESLPFSGKNTGFLEDPDKLKIQTWILSPFFGAPQDSQ